MLKGKTIMKGMLVTNAFLNNNRFNVLYEMLMTSFKEKNITLDIITNDKLLMQNDELKLDYNFAIFWDKDIMLAKYLEDMGLKVFNSSKAISLCDDKGLTFLALNQKKIKMPKTIISPFTFRNIPYNKFEFVDEVIKTLKLPLVIKVSQSSFGAGVYLVQTKGELLNKLKEIGTERVIFQEFIASSFGTDVRVEVVCGEAIGAVRRINSKGDFRSNVLAGGTMEKYNASKDFLQMASQTAQILGLDFGGIDIMFGPNEEPIFCEANSNCHFRTFFTVTGINLANYIRDYIINKIGNQ